MDNRLRRRLDLVIFVALGICVVLVVVLFKINGVPPLGFFVGAGILSAVVWFFFFL